MGKDEETASCVRKKAAVVFGEKHNLDETRVNNLVLVIWNLFADWRIT